MDFSSRFVWMKHSQNTILCVTASDQKLYPGIFNFLFIYFIGMNCTGWDLIVTEQNKKEITDAGGLKVRKFEQFEEDWSVPEIRFDDKD